VLARSGGELPSGYLAKRFGHSWPTTTRHLRVLEQAGLIIARRAGRTCHYRLNRERLDETLRGWLDKIEAPEPTQRWSSTGSKHTKGLRK